jgi:hypothetical protein
MSSRFSGAAAMSNRRATLRAASRNAGCAVTSLTRSPSMKIARPSRSERRYSDPVRIPEDVPPAVAMVAPSSAGSI